MNPKDLRNEIVELEKMREMIDDRIAFLQDQIDLRRTSKVATNGTLYTGVMAIELKPYIQEWIDQGFTVQALADKALLSTQTIYRVMQESEYMVRVSTADAILQALGLPHIFNQIVPDPPEGQYYEE